MRVRVPDPNLAGALEALGSSDADPAEGVLFAPARVQTWQEAEDELTVAFHLAQQATLANAPVVFLVDSASALGRATPLDSAVATGLVSGGRCLAFEGQRHDQYAAVFAYEPGVAPEAIAEAVASGVSSGAGLGQMTMLGSSHLGAMLP